MYIYIYIYIYIFGGKQGKVWPQQESSRLQGKGLLVLVLVGFRAVEGGRG